MNRPENWTGERLETFIRGETMWEHLHRYAIAMELVKAKKVLDIACGEGYGARLMAGTAAHVTAMDIDDATIQKAKAKYKAPNLDFRTGSIEQVGAGNGSFDIITCFETLEHLEEHDKVLQELKRLLVPGGTLVISTPEKANYSDRTGYKNPFHKKELYGDEFKNLLKRFFLHVNFYHQASFSGSLMMDETQQGLKRFYTGDFEAISASAVNDTLYWLAIASDQIVELPPSSIFRDQKRIDGIRDEQIAQLKKTITYRTGHIILAPFKFIRSLFRR